MGLNPSRAYKVFVGNQDKIDFEKYRTVSPNEVNLKKLEAKLDYDEKRIEIWMNEIDDTKKRIDDIAEYAVVFKRIGECRRGKEVPAHSLETS